MNVLAANIRQSTVANGISLWWLGQAGFAFKNAAGQIIYMDPYLSDAAERLHGFKRLSLAPIQVEDVQADLVILTHEHTDHLDPDAVPVIARNNPHCVFAGPTGCANGLGKAGVSSEKTVILKPNSMYDLGPVIVHTVPADHGDYSPSGLAMVLDFQGVRVLVSGDSSLRTGWFKPLFDLKPDVVLVCINGVFGNMNHIDAAMLVQQAKPRFAIPCHFWTFAEQGGGDPGGFVHACGHFCPQTQVVLLKPGEEFRCPKSNIQETSAQANGLISATKSR